MKAEDVLLYLKEEQRVADMSPCLLWMGTQHSEHRGAVPVEELDKKVKPVTHIVWFVLKGEWPKQLNHLCNQAACVIHVYEGYRRPNAIDKRDENNHRGQKLTREKVQQIKNLYWNDGLSQQKIGEMFGVTHTTISQIVTGATWRDV